MSGMVQAGSNSLYHIVKYLTACLVNTHSSKSMVWHMVCKDEV